MAAARELQFELAARLRDEIGELKKELRGMDAAGRDGRRATADGPPAGQARTGHGYRGGRCPARSTVTPRPRPRWRARLAWPGDATRGGSCR